MPRLTTWPATAASAIRCASAAILGGVCSVSGAGLACEPGRRSREDLALQPQLLVLAPQPGQIVALGRGQPITLLLPAALLPVRLCDPVADRLRRRFEFSGKVNRIATGADQLDHLATEFRRIRRPRLGHRKAAD
jgi:hypothetical protein